MGFKKIDEKSKTQKTGIVYSFFRLCCAVVFAFGIFFIIIIIVTVLLTRDVSTPITSKPRKPVTREKQKEKVQTKQIVTKNEEDDVTYSIIDSDTFLDYKRSLDVRLNKKVSEATLRTIALKLKAQDSRSYERTFICYYLPGMEVGAGAWATTHFNPNLKVKILGMTADQEKTLKQLPDDPSREVIGIWLDESPFIGSRITIFRQNRKLFMENMYTDGSSGKKEIVEKLSGRKRTFRRKEGSSVGEFYLIDKHGNLQMWDQEGIIWTAKKIN